MCCWGCYNWPDTWFRDRLGLNFHLGLLWEVWTTRSFTMGGRHIHIYYQQKEPHNYCMLCAPHHQIYTDSSISVSIKYIALTFSITGVSLSMQGCLSPQLLNLNPSLHIWVGGTTSLSSFLLSPQHEALQLRKQWDCQGTQRRTSWLLRKGKKSPPPYRDQIRLLFYGGFTLCLLCC